MQNSKSNFLQQAGSASANTADGEPGFNYEPRAARARRERVRTMGHPAPHNRRLGTHGQRPLTANHTVAARDAPLRDRHILLASCIQPTAANPFASTRHLQVWNGLADIHSGGSRFGQKRTSVSNRSWPQAARENSRLSRLRRNSSRIPRRGQAETPRFG
jgi:hypothetical protein